MRTITIKDITIGEGIPKICAPIVGQTKDQILKSAKEFIKTPIDLVEWRADWFEDVSDLEKVKEILKELNKILNMPILFTFRTLKEGGQKFISDEDYLKLNKYAVDTGNVELIDVEFFTGEELVKELIRYAHSKDVYVIASNHDFEKTPRKEKIIERLKNMQDIGADIPKIAVMPQKRQDVLELLQATSTMNEQYATGPIVTMSMDGMGIISRLCGEVIGSAITFGAIQTASAPGQIDVNELSNILRVLHDSIAAVK